MNAPDTTRGGTTQTKVAEGIGDLNFAAGFPTTQPIDSITTRPPGGTPLCAERARELTDTIRGDMTKVWAQLLRAYEGNAHGALGYSSWGDYCSAEFGIERSRSYRMLNAARVVEVLAPASQSPMGDSTDISERVARELTPLLDEPETLVETFEEAKAEAPKAADGTPKVTAARVRDKVHAKVWTKPAASKPNPRHLADRPIESDTRTLPVTSIAPTSGEPQSLAEAVRNVTAAVRNGAPGPDVVKAVAAAQKVRGDRNSLPGSAVLTKLVDELLAAVQTLIKRGS